MFPFGEASFDFVLFRARIPNIRLGALSSTGGIQRSYGPIVLAEVSTFDAQRHVRDLVYMPEDFGSGDLLSCGIEYLT